MKRFGAIAMIPLLSGCTHLFFQPDRKVYNPPERFAARYDRVRFHSADGTELAGLWLHSSTGPVKGTVIHFHGNAENLTSHAGFSHWLTAFGYDVFIFDYRGYGESGGSPSQDGLVHDGIAAIEFARRRSESSRDRLVVWGQSLGGAVAIASLGLLPEKSGIRAIVLENTFDSYRSMARDVLSRSWITWPLQWLPWIAVSDKHRPSKYFSRLPPCPILVVHGDSDHIVSFRLGERLFRKLRDPKEFWRVPGGDHLETFSYRAAEFRPKLVEFLDKALRPAAANPGPRTSPKNSP